MPKLKLSKNRLTLKEAAIAAGIGAGVGFTILFYTEIYALKNDARETAKIIANLAKDLNKPLR